MSKVMFAFLGTSDYLACNYVLNDKKVENVRFIQEALASMLCRDWNEEDRIVIFLTEEAKKKNWVDNGHIDKKTGKPLPREGLEKRLKSLNLKTKIIPVDIPDGSSEDELWNIFDIVFNQINEQDEIIFDITHALRSLPMLVMIILNYARVLRHARIKGIYYGAFEVLGSPSDVEKMEMKDRNAPIFDLTRFAYLFNWTTAINNFLTYGDARNIYQLTEEELAPIFRETKVKNEKAVNIKDFGSKLKSFTESIQTTRGLKIVRDFNYEKLKELINSNKESIIKPLNPLLGRISDRMGVFKNGSIDNGYAAVEWCIEHDLIQQGYTFLQETMISEIVAKHFGLEKIAEREVRKIVTYAINEKFKQNLVKEHPEYLSKIKDNEDSKYKDIAPEMKEKVKEIMDSLDDVFVKVYDAISQYRNDINHAGFKHNFHKPEGLKNKLIEFYEKVRNINRR